MKRVTLLMPIVVIGTMVQLLPSSAFSANTTPASTYFSLAVSDNSHNHYGENLLYLRFETGDQMDKRHSRTVISRRVTEGAITLDGQVDEWPEDTFTEIPGRTMNNYPLSRHYDATPTAIRIGSAYDDDYVYFVVNFEDANHDASVNRNRWIYRNGVWETMSHVVPNDTAPAAQTVNRGEAITGKEDEDQLFMMFPITDSEKNFTDGGAGCAGYCHANLVLTPDPKEANIGDGVSAMHTNYPDDVADLWHWTATRSRPMNTLKDGYIDYGDESYNGRKVDDGTAPFDNNAAMEPFRPTHVSRKAYQAGEYNRAEFYTPVITADDAMPITDEMSFAEGVSLPFYLHKAATGSRADVETAANFDPGTKRWTVELRRKRVTDDDRDHQFIAGPKTNSPTTALLVRGDSDRGAKLYKEKTCAACHGEQGEGFFEEGKWTYPRNQRASGPLIRKTASPLRPKRLNNLAAELKRFEEDPPHALMPFVPLSPQEAEDIGAWLQKQFIPVNK